MSLKTILMFLFIEPSVLFSLNNLFMHLLEKNILQLGAEGVLKAGNLIFLILSDVVFIPDIFGFLFHFCNTGYLLV